MSLASGTRIGPYEVIATIGVGGMGEVYRARDTKLDRDVALKVLPTAFALDADRRARFQREAHVLAALNHPHIAQIHGLEDNGGQSALVMELVEGPTLADRIAEGPIPYDEALAIARQISEALAAAHDHGIVHRDLKPANIKVRHDGTVKVLDFGLAKAVESVPGASDLVNSPTLTSPSMTRQGVVLGTAAYMAPEQARGRPVDKRADIWAFGVVLFEMLTGRSVFAGDDVTDTIASVVKTQPDLRQVPPSLRRLLSRCLEKDPSRRLRDIGDAWDLIESPSTSVDVTASPARRLGWLAIGGVVLAAAVFSAWSFAARDRSASRPVPTRLVDSLPDTRTMPRGFGTAGVIALAPNGRTLVYVARENGLQRLYRRFLDTLETEPIGDPGASEPFFSPDSQSVGFRVGESLRRVSVRGGPSAVIATLPQGPAPPRGASWHTDGTIVVGGIGAIWRVSANGGPVDTIMTAAEGTTVFCPELLPGGRSLLYTERVLPVGAVTTIVRDLQTGASKRLLAGACGRYLSTGHLVFARGISLWAARFDIDRLEVRGDESAAVQSIRFDGGVASFATQAAVAPTGALAYVPGALTPQRTLAWINPAGGEQTVEIEPRPYASPRVSPDGKRIAFCKREEGFDIWVWEIERRRLRQVTNDPTPNYLAEWFPDSKRLALSAMVNNVTQIHEQTADGSGVPRLLTERAFPSAISRDEKHLLFGQPMGAQWDIGVLPLSEPSARRVFWQTPEVERNPVISPDGRWLAYESERSGRPEIYVRPFPDIDAAEIKVTTDGAISPVWSRDGRQLFYWKESGTLVSIMAVPILPGPKFDFGTARQVIQGRFVRPSWDTHYDQAPDGRFIVLKAVGAPPREEIVTVLNWSEELKRLLPIE